MFAAHLVLAIHLASAQPAQLELGGRALPAIKGGARIRPIVIPVQPPQFAPRPAPVALPGTGTTSTTVGGPGDATVLQKAHVGATDDELVAFFRKRTPPAPPKEAVLALIEKLGAKDAAVADRAAGELDAIGPAAVPALQEAANNTDLGEGAIRARQCLAANQGPEAAQLVTHAARLLATRKPAAAAEVLIAYLPFAEDDTVLAEIEVALAAVTARDGKADPAVLKALADPSPVRRGAAAGALCKAGGTTFHAEIRPLLQDARPSVRLRVAIGLVGAYDAEAVPVLISLLGHLSPAQRAPVEELLTGLAGEWAVSGPRGNDARSNRLRRDVWAAWWKNVEGDALLEEVKKRTASDADREKALGLIQKLGADDAETREAAGKDLIAMGGKAGPLLRQAVASGDPRVGAFAARCLEAIGEDDAGALPSATPRLLALRRPAGTVAALVAYLPSAETPATQAQVVDILAAIGCPAGKADPALVEALGDPLAVRRACAAEALCKGKAAAHLPALKKLLADKDRQVVLRAARGLASMGQKESIPALIGLLADLPIEQAWDVEEFLDVVAGDKAPAVSLAADAAGRARAVEAWKAWWKENEKTDLARIDLTRRDLGVYLVVEGYNQPLGSAGRILEVDPSGKVRWEFRGVNYPNDAQMLRNGNLLVVEQEQRITERDRTGKIVGMDRVYGQTFHVERLRNGNTFLACRNLLTVLDPKGAAVFTHQFFNARIIGARRFRDGSMAFVAQNGQYVKIDGAGKQLESRSLDFSNRSPVAADIAADGRVVLCDQARSVVAEFGKDGKLRWEVSAPTPYNPVRTAGGNILVTCNNMTAVYEIDPSGKLVRRWDGFAFRPVKIFRR